MSKTMSAFRGSLDGYYQVENADGTFGPVKPAGNITDFSIIPDAEISDVLSTGNADYGQAADSYVEAKPTKVSMTVNRFNLDNMAMVHMGTYAARVGAGGAGAEESHTVSMGDMIKLNGFDLDSVVVKDVTDATTYVEDTDYEIVDAALGIIKPIGTNIEDGDVLHITPTWDAETGYALSGGTKSSYFVKFWGRGINRYNNKRTLVQVPRMSIKPGGNFSVVGTEAASVQYDATINVPTDGSAPYTLVTDP